MPERRRERKKSATKSAAEKRREIEAGLRARGFGGVDEYRDWCIANGFATRLDKSDAEMAAEEAVLRWRAQEKALAEARKTARNPSDQIRRICETLQVPQTLPRAMRIVGARVREAPREVRPSLQTLLLHVARVGELISEEAGVRAFGPVDGNSYASALCALAWHAGSWRRPVEEWRPRSHNLRRQFGELARYLLARYDVPAFMDSVFFEGLHAEALRHQCWFVHVGAGKNIRAADVPLTLTAKMAHHVLQAPAQFTVLEALRWGQIHGLGGNARLVNAVLGTRLRDQFAHDEFWSSVLQWLVANPMLDPAWIGPLVDYLQWIKFSDEATEPNLVMKGRTATALLRRVEEWHDRLGKMRRVKEGEWKPSGLPEWQYEEGKFENGTFVRWSVHELLSAKALYDEGDAMHHCVGTYHHSCASGRVAIFSLLKQDKTGHWRWLTIEVEISTRRVVQARGIYNRVPDDGSLRVLKSWAARAGLDVAAYL